MLATRLGIAGEVKLAILPFRLNAEEDIGYMGRAVRDMLASRISSGTSVVVIDHSTVKETLVKKGYPDSLPQKEIQGFGGTLGADYVLYGSIAKIGSNVSIDIDVLSVPRGVVDSVVAHSIGIDEVIPQMNTLAHKIREIVTSEVKTPFSSVTSLPPPENEGRGPEPVSKEEVIKAKSIEESDLLDDEQELNILEYPSRDTPQNGEGNPSTVDIPSPTLLKGKEGGTKKELQPKIEPASDNPVYQRSVDELENPLEPNSKAR